MQKSAAAVCKQLGVKVFYFENGCLPNTTTMDAKGMNFYNSVPREASFYAGIKEPFQEQPFVERMNPDTALELALPRKYIFCPFQDWLDSQVILNSPWIKDMREFYSVIEYLASNTPGDLFFIIKKDPSCKKEYKDLAERQNPRIIFANNAKTESLIKNARAILTINSTVGIEAIMFGKNVITLGNAFYAGYGLALSASNPAEALEALYIAQMRQPNQELAQKFLSYLQNYYLISGSWKNPPAEHLKEICRRLEA
jgi:capsular polysaccharide export protein